MKTTAHTIAAQPVCKVWKANDLRPRPVLGRFHISLTTALLGLAVVALGGPQRASAQGCGLWEQKFPAFSPSPRYDHAIAYDSDRGVTVLFGGSDNPSTGVTGDTWEWDGEAWTRRATDGPSRRYIHAMAYDNRRGVTVLFGGRSHGGENGETWEWDGTIWKLRSVTGPSPRHDHALTYDSARGVTVLFGGRNDEGYNGETWEWDGATWTQRCLDCVLGVTSPMRREGHALVYDSHRGVTLLFGGYPGGYNGETWEWDGVAWRQRVSSGPSQRTVHAMAYDSARGVAVLFGGRDAVNDNGETWEWDGAVWRQRIAAGPSPRWGHALAFDSRSSVVLLFGGYGGAYDGKTWEYSPDCNCNGVRDDRDVQSFNSGDSNLNGIPDECEPCELIAHFKIKDKGSCDRCKVRASVLTTLREGTELTLCFEGDADCGCRTVTINDRGRAKAACVTLIKGDHRVCIQECPDLCRTVTCRP